MRVLDKAKDLKDIRHRHIFAEPHEKQIMIMTVTVTEAVAVECTSKRTRNLYANAAQFEMNYRKHILKLSKQSFLLKSLH